MQPTSKERGLCFVKISHLIFILSLVFEVQMYASLQGYQSSSKVCSHNCQFRVEFIVISVLLFTEMSKTFRK